MTQRGSGSHGLQGGRTRQVSTRALLRERTSLLDAASASIAKAEQALLLLAEKWPEGQSVLLGPTATAAALRQVLEEVRAQASTLLPLATPPAPPHPPQQTRDGTTD